MVRKRRRKSKRPTLLLYILTALAVAAILLFIASVIYESGYLSGYEEGYAKAKAQFLQQQRTKAKKHQHSNVKKHHKASPKTPPSTPLSEVEDYRRSKKVATTKVSEPRSNATSSKKGKLVIIIDDVAYGYQVKKLLALHLPLTLSFFPPSPRHPDTARLAKRVPHAMVHLPLEALHYKNEEHETLHVGDSYERIVQVVASIRNNFPHATYVNNHTGSRFTADKRAMEQLVRALDRYGFVFVDSRTTPLTKVAEVMHSLGRRYLHRDIFLDNEQRIDYIRSQLKKAIAIANRRGYAIAIAHPHPVTIEALRRSRSLLAQVRLVYIDQL